MKQNRAEQPFEAYERLKKELEEVNESLDVFKSNRTGEFKISYADYSVLFGFRKSINLNEETFELLIEVLESKKQQIENELNNLLNA